ncbi:MAG: hypothetical protein E6Q83_03365 [Thiothrix sp.]|nr:MAG: hypothetical protein E6Q83_03365 [Thiothrix sp.]
MDCKPPKFRRIDSRRLLEKTAHSRIAWALDISEDEIRKWPVLVPVLESQYLRESYGCRHKVDRRRIRKTTAIALFKEGIDELAVWLGQADAVDQLYTNDVFLTEYQSLLIEYATKGAIKGISLRLLDYPAYGVIS